MGGLAVTAGYFVYVLAAFLVAALLCALFGDGLGQLTGAPPHKLIGRLGLIIALLGFWPFLQWQGLNRGTELGYAGPISRLARAFAGGFGVGLLILLVLVGTLMALGVRTAPDAGLAFDGRLLKTLALGLLGGLLVALIEETFFRGALYGAIQRRGGLVAAVSLSSLLYAALHFFKPQPIPPGTDLSLGACLESLAGAFGALSRPENLDSLLALFLVGLVLALARARAGHLGWSLGLHASWVLAIALTREYTDLTEGAHLGWLVGSYDGVIGWLAAGWLAVLSLGLALGFRRLAPEPSGASPDQPKNLK